MDTDLLPWVLTAKLVGALALCFAGLVGAAWMLRRRWPGLAKLGAVEQRHPGLQVIESRGLAPGTSLHLLEIEGTRLLVLQTKERGDVLWTRERGEAGFDAEVGAEPQAKPEFEPEPTLAAHLAEAPEPEDGTLASHLAAMAGGRRTRLRPSAAPLVKTAARASAKPTSTAARAEAAQAKTRPQAAAPARRQAAPAPLRNLAEEVSPILRLRELELQRERQRRYRERRREAAQPQSGFALAGYRR
jgi:flagellar biogenesis protein FliO